jgi:hypothetical protein
MKLQRLLVALTVVNLALLTFLLLANARLAAADGAAPVLRGRGLEIVDGQGRIRASIAVLPATTQANGETSAETVLLITERGRPSVKIGASEQAAGMSLAGPTGTRDTYVILQAQGTASSLKLRSEDGREQVFQP